jgi:hypothetical protein
MQSNVNELIELIPTYQERILELFASISSTLSLPSFMNISTLLD